MPKHTDFSLIKLLILDMDGVMTDGSIFLAADGIQMRRFHAHDGQGIKYLHQKGIMVGIITGSRETDIVQRRADMLGIPSELVAMDTRDKAPVYERWLRDYSLQPDQVAYIGDDVPDIPLMSAVGISACPADAVTQARESADIILLRAGGQGCVREFIDQILATLD